MGNAPEAAVAVVVLAARDEAEAICCGDAGWWSEILLEFKAVVTCDRGHEWRARVVDAEGKSRCNFVRLHASMRSVF